MKWGGWWCLDVLNESTSLSLPEDVAETDSSAAASYRLSFAIRTGGREGDGQHSRRQRSKVGQQAKKQYHEKRLQTAGRQGLVHIGNSSFQVRHKREGCAYVLGRLRERIKKETQRNSSQVE